MPRPLAPAEPALQEGRARRPAPGASPLRLALAIVALVAVLVGAAGCGSDASSSPDTDATVLLDFTPNAIHAGIYSAVARGYDQAEGVTLHIRVPGASADGARLLSTGRVDFAVLDIHDLALARQRGEDVVGVLALVQHPLAAVEAAPGFATPRALEGQRVGVTGAPSDLAVLRSVVTGAGGDPARVRTTSIGFDAVPALLSGRVAAVTAFWDVEGLALHARQPGTREFRVDAYGAPAYPELILCVTRRTLDDQPNLVRATVMAVRRGYALTQTDPESSLQDEQGRVPGLDAGALRRQLDALSGVLADPAGAFGTLDPARLGAWATWEARFGIVRTPPDPAAAFDDRWANAQLPGG